MNAASTSCANDHRGEEEARHALRLHAKLHARAALSGCTLRLHAQAARSGCTLRLHAAAGSKRLHPGTACKRGRASEDGGARVVHAGKGVALTGMYCTAAWPVPLSSHWPSSLRQYTFARWRASPIASSTDPLEADEIACVARRTGRVSCCVAVATTSDTASVRRATLASLPSCCATEKSQLRAPCHSGEPLPVTLLTSNRAPFFWLPPHPRALSLYHDIQRVGPTAGDPMDILVYGHGTGQLSTRRLPHNL